MKKASLLLILASGALLASCGHHVLTPEEISSWEAEHPVSVASSEDSSIEPSVEPSSQPSEESSVDVSVDTSDESSVDITEDTSDDTIEDTSDDTIEDTSETTSEDTSEVTSEPVSSPYTVTIGTETKELVENSAATLVEGQLGEYMVTGLTLTAGDSIVFAKDGVAITENIGGDPEDATNKNNAIISGTTFTVHNDATDAGIYFKTWSDGGHSFWVTGYEKGEDPDTTLSEIYFTNNKGWSNVYAYLWDGESKNADWPGVKLENPETNGYGEPVYKVEVGAFKNVIFNDGNGTQTVDISLADVADKTGFYPDGDKNAEGKYPVGSYQHD